MELRISYDNANGPGGSTHGAELAAFYDAPGTNNTDQDKMYEQMRQYWTSFVTIGTPVAEGGITWTPVSDELGNNRLVFHPGAIGFENATEQINRCRIWHSTGLEMDI